MGCVRYDTRVSETVGNPLTELYPKPASNILAPLSLDEYLFPVFHQSFIEKCTRYWRSVTSSMWYSGTFCSDLPVTTTLGIYLSLEPNLREEVPSSKFGLQGFPRLDRGTLLSAGTKRLGLSCPVLSQSPVTFLGGIT